MDNSSRQDIYQQFKPNIVGRVVRRSKYYQRVRFIPPHRRNKRRLGNMITGRAGRNYTIRVVSQWAYPFFTASYTLYIGGPQSLGTSQHHSSPGSENRISISGSIESYVSLSASISPTYISSHVVRSVVYSNKPETSQPVIPAALLIRFFTPGRRQF